MPLTAGTRLGPYEIQASIGAGGMGEVYRARDTRLDRTVAVKILPPPFAGDLALRERFDREARLISSLNHPHICALFDVGEQDGLAYLVIEHLEGETLAARLEKGHLKIDHALQIAVQLASALDSAHRAGVVHRDVKPGNVMLTRAGAKLLDFGLARSKPLLSPLSGSSLAPTTPPAVTAQGAILGTLQYMSPEQLEGSEADARTDIFAFGAVVYEMMTGETAFTGKSQASLIASIMAADPPPIVTLQPLAPAALDRVVRKCLARDPDDRWQSAKDLGDELSWIARAESTTDSLSALKSARPQVASRTRERVFATISTLLGVSLIAALMAGRFGLLSPVTQRLPLRVSLNPPPGTSTETTAPGRRLAISPDGRFIVFSTVVQNQQRFLTLRRTDSLKAQTLPGTQGANNPFWSPDSKSIGFVSQGQIKRIEVSGGPALTIASDAVNLGASWNREDVILFSTGAGGLKRVSASGGPAVAVSTLDTPLVLSDPVFLNDGRHFLFQATELGSAGIGGVYVGSLDSREKPKRVLGLNSNAIASSGYLLFVRDRDLLAQPFDETRLELSGSTSVLGNDLEMSTGALSASFSVSSTGLLAYQTGAAEVRTELTWFGRDGVRLGTVSDVADQMAVALSPDASGVAVSGLDPAKNARDIWTVDIKRNVRTRFTFDTADEMNPLWSYDGREIYFTSRRHGRLDLFKKPASGGGAEVEVLADAKYNLYPTSVSPDGKFLLFFTGNALSPTGNDLWVLPLARDAKPKPFVQTEFNETYAAFSPDGRWVAYSSGESGRAEIYVVPFPGPGGKWQVSQGGGSFPRWRRDSTELFYLSPDGTLMAASVDGRGSSFVVSLTKPLFVPRIRTTGFGGSNAYNYDVTPDGQRFLIAVTEGTQGETPITLLTNWTSAIVH